MEALTQSFGRNELAQLQLRKLFEQRGFKRVKVSKFEEYALYVENKNFLNTESIITFMDLDGKLLALKPDVTLSIVKNIPKKPMPAAQKLYYIDEVYRLSHERREYKVHNQIGVELIGPLNKYANLEIIDLALGSLGLIGEHFALDISHMAFVSGLLSEMNLSHRTEALLLENVHAKNTWDIAQILEQAGAQREKIDQILTLTGIHGGFSTALEQVRGLICNDQMRDAYEELAQVSTVLNGSGGNVNLDFSVVNDVDYYNGLIFRGYVEGIPSLVLTGGCYDNLLRRLGKRSSAIGFAVLLDDLDIYLKNGKRRDLDLLITYPDDCDFAALLALVREQCANGNKVRLEREDCELSGAGFSFERHCRFVNGVLEEVASC